MDLRLLPFLFFAAGCAAPDTTGIKLIGHGGLGPNVDHPMNSREAVLAALDKGLDGVELDVQLTADTVLVAFHDLDLSVEGNCTGPVNTHTWKELRSCTNDMPITGAHDVLLEAIRSHPGAEFTFDVKLNTKADWNTYLSRFARAIAALNAEPGLNGKIIVECKVMEFLVLLKQLDAGIPVFLYCDDASTGIAEATKKGLDGITIDVDRLNTEQAQAVKANGLQLTVFDVAGNRSKRRAVELGADRIQVDQ
mgnify:CR=1 FL=1